MIDPLAEVVAMLRPAARLSKLVGGAGAWRIRRAELGQPFYCAVLDGDCILQMEDDAPVLLHTGDFALIPAARSFSMTSATAAAAAAPAPDRASTPVTQADGVVRVGRQDGAPDVTLLVGHCAFGSPDAALLVTLLPQLVLVRDQPRLGTLVQLVSDESRANRPARDIILARLLEVLFIEALRSQVGPASAPGLVRALADERLAAALRCIHAHPARPWTVSELARQAALSRSAFFARFSRALGMAPMAYLLDWRMALARDLLAKGQGGVAMVAQQVGYSSASAFSVAFTRHVGMPPARYGQQAAQGAVAHPHA